MAVPIVAVYFLGYDLGLSDEPVIDVCPEARERRTGRRLDAGHPFVSSLRHRSRVIQIPRLAKRRRDELERFLSIFDQAQASAGDSHVLRIEEEDYPREWDFVLRRLRAAMAEQDVRRSMEGEDELLRDSVVLAQLAEEERRRAEAADQRADEQRQRVERMLARSVRQLHRLGQDAAEIAAALSVDLDEVRRILST